MTEEAARDATHMAETFRLLADGTRLRILLALLDAGSLAVGEIAAAVDVTGSAASHQLRLLRMAGIVRTAREGRSVRYRLADDHVRVLLEVARAHLDHE